VVVQAVVLDQLVVLWVLGQQIKVLQVVLERERQAQMLTLEAAAVVLVKLDKTESTVLLVVAMAATE
jgi:hypothetical protein|tara:strand:- start:233 stop:433 length:201 start_codon:yes stop_codon:yes gene_type:complete